MERRRGLTRRRRRPRTVRTRARTSRHGRGATWATLARSNGGRRPSGRKPRGLQVRNRRPLRLIPGYEDKYRPREGSAMPFVLPPLPYGFDALAPHIDAKTMEIHHDKHHAAYIANANKALENHPTLAAKSVEDLLWGINEVPEDIRTVIRNNAGGHSNHSIFWTIMGPGGGGNPQGRIGDGIKTAFGSYDAFKELLQKTAVGQFGSGWAWLVVDKQAKLSGQGYPNQDRPDMDWLTPILGVDVWEHSHYLNYQNRPADYVTACVNALNWAAIETRFSSVWS